MAKTTRSVSSRRAAGKGPRLKNGFRSAFEQKVAEEAERVLGFPLPYETNKVKYTVPARDATYTPDFELPNGIIIEAKGVFDVDDRQKHLLIKQQYPELDIRFVFYRSATKIYKGSPTSYADWCKKHGFLYADKTIPLEWIKEKKK